MFSVILRGNGHISQNLSLGASPCADIFHEYWPFFNFLSNELDLLTFFVPFYFLHLAFLISNRSIPLFFIVFFMCILARQLILYSQLSEITSCMVLKKNVNLQNNWMYNNAFHCWTTLKYILNYVIVYRRCFTFFLGEKQGIFSANKLSL